MVKHDDLYDVEDALASRICDLEEFTENLKLVVVRLVERVDQQKEQIKELQDRLDAHRDILKQS